MCARQKLQRPTHGRFALTLPSASADLESHTTNRQPVYCGKRLKSHINTTSVDLKTHNCGTNREPVQVGRLENITIPYPNRFCPWSCVKRHVRLPRRSTWPVVFDSTEPAPNRGTYHTTNGQPVGMLENITIPYPSRFWPCSCGETREDAAAFDMAGCI